MSTDLKTISSHQSPTPQSRAEYWEGRLRELPGLDGVGFIGYGVAFNEWMYRVRRRVFVREISRLSLDWNNASVLDIGSGTGFWVETWKSLGVQRLTATDLTQVASSNLRKRFPEFRVEQLDITSTEAVKGLQTQFSAISMIDVLFHITSDDAFSAAIRNISELLLPGGYFIFSENLPHREMPRAPSQVNRTLQEVTGILTRNGLKVITRVPFFVLMNTPFDTRWSGAPKLWRAFMTPLQIFPWLGQPYGALLFPLECAALSVFKEGPSTEFVVCQKIQVPAMKQ